MPKKPSRKILELFVLALFSLNLYVWGNLFYEKERTDLNFYAFDVGQGDAIYFKTPFGQDVLVDGGPDKKVLESLSKTMPFWDRKIELMILTHPHADHVTGLNSVLDRYKVEKVVYSGALYDSQVYKDFLNKIEEEGAEIFELKRNDEIDFGENHNFLILGPKNLEGSEKNINNTSLAGILKYKNFKVFLSGDAEEEEWETILETDHELEAQVLKAAHHGSSNGTTEKILNSVKPEVAIISSGTDNRYGHPHEEVLDLFEKFKAKILRTDEAGIVMIISNGEKYEVK